VRKTSGLAYLPLLSFFCGFPLCAAAALKDPSQVVFGSPFGVVTPRRATCTGKFFGRLKLMRDGLYTEGGFSAPVTVTEAGAEVCVTFSPGTPIEPSRTTASGGTGFSPRLPGALLIVDVVNGADLGGTRFERGAMVVVENVSGRLVYRRAQPNDKVVLSQPNSVLERSLPAGPIKVPPSGNLLSFPRSSAPTSTPRKQ
jgi:hypothetical protein